MTILEKPLHSTYSKPDPIQSALCKWTYFIFTDYYEIEPVIILTLLQEESEVKKSVEVKHDLDFISKYVYQRTIVICIFPDGQISVLLK